MSTSISSTSSLTSTGSISSAGLGSGLDVNSIVTQLMAVEKQPLTQLQTQADTLNTTLSVVGKIQSNFSTLQSKLSALSSTTLWSGTTPTSSDTSYVKVASNASTTTTASAGSHSIAVTRLATPQTLASSAVTSASTAVGTGTLTIELGTWGSGTPAADFTAKTDSSAVSITIDESHDTLEQIRDKINSASAGVTAAIVKDASGARLTLRSKDTGAENGFRVSVSEDNDDGDPATGLSMLAFDASADSTPMQRTSSAGNAELKVDGIAISSASNTVSDAIDGLKLTLVKPTTTDVDVSVAANTDAIKTAVTDFVSAFNTLASYIGTQTGYNADSKVGGTLQGDQGTLALQRQLRSVVNTAFSGSSSYSRLSDIGISFKTDGTLQTDSTKLDTALNNLSDLKQVLLADGSDVGSTGFARRFKKMVDAALDTDGALTTRTQGIQQSLTRNQKSQDDMQTRLTKTEARLRTQYQTLDTTMSSLNSLSSYVTKMVAGLSSSA